MANFIREMEHAYSKAKSSIDDSFFALSFIETDFKYFLVNFFRDDINKNLFLTQVFYDNENSMNDFQSYVFNKATIYFSKLISIDGLSFYYDASLPLSSIDLILSDTKIASINIFYKELILYEGVFFEEIDKGIERKARERDKLVDTYNNQVQSLNNFSLLSDSSNSNIAKSALNNTIFKNRTKKERLMNLDSLNMEILQIEDEISELMITKQLLIKNMNNIQYFQEKIQNRVGFNLKYRVTKK